MIDIQRTKTPREVVEMSASCFAPVEMFTKNWSDIPKPFQEIYEQENIPCEGSGLPGLWCRLCPFGDVEEL